jgi:hypothetical protein
MERFIERKTQFSKYIIIRDFITHDYLKTKIDLGILDLHR